MKKKMSKLPRFKKKESKRIVIEVQSQIKKAPYRAYSDAEIDEFLKEDKLTPDFIKKVQNNNSKRIIGGNYQFIK